MDTSLTPVPILATQPRTEKGRSLFNPARLALLWTGVLVFFTVGYFENHRPYANVNSQFALTCAVVERHTFSIDAYHDNYTFSTIDKAFFNGHYYCDKSPVLAFFGVPVFAAYRWIAGQPRSQQDYHMARYCTTLLTVGVAAALLAMMTAAALMRRGVAPARAAMAGALWIAATPLLGYSVLMYGYVPAGAMMMGSYLLAAPMLESPTALYPARLFAAGFFMGLAAWTMNTCALIALAMTAALLIGAIGGAPAERPWWRRAWGRLWPWALGGLLGIAGYFVYTYTIFGSFSSPYRYEAVELFRDEMAKGLWGATWPRWQVAWLVTFHKYQGLFRYFPLTALALAGALWGMVRGRRGEPGGDITDRAIRIENTLACFVFFALLAYVSAYYMWWGGAAYAPRHLLPALPLLGLGLAPWLRGHGAAGRVLFCIGLVSAFFNVTAVSVDPQAYPMFIHEAEMLHPRLDGIEWTSPYMTDQVGFWIKENVDYNLGYELGLDGPESLLPLGVVWVAAWGGLCFVARRRKGEGGTAEEKEERVSFSTLAQ